VTVPGGRAAPGTPGRPRHGWHAWHGAPAPVRRLALGTAAVLGYGTAVHLLQLAAGGTDVHPGLSGWLRGYFVALTLLDPLASALLLRRRRSGVLLAVAVLVTDAAANAWANHGLDPATGVTPGRLGQGVITLLALVLLAAAPALWRWADPHPPVASADGDRPAR
jgi:hypothetical protein